MFVIYLSSEGAFYLHPLFYLKEHLPHAEYKSHVAY